MGQLLSIPIYLVDDEPLVRSAISATLKSHGLVTTEFGSAEEFLGALDELERGCIISDVRMPGMSGVELVRQLKANNIDHPVIIMSGMADIALAVEAMKAGAADFLEKPLTSAALVEAVSSAALRTTDEPPPEKDRSAEIFQTLTRRQLDVLKGIVEGLPNKLIAYRLGLSPRTVEAYRAAIMERTQAKSLSHLVRMSISAGL